MVPIMLFSAPPDFPGLAEGFSRKLVWSFPRSILRPLGHSTNIHPKRTQGLTYDFERFCLSKEGASCIMEADLYILEYSFQNYIECFELYRKQGSDKRYSPENQQNRVGHQNSLEVQLFIADHRARMKHGQ